MLEDRYCTDLTNPFLLSVCTNSDRKADDGEVELFQRPVWQSGGAGYTTVTGISLGGADSDKRKCDSAHINKRIKEDVSLEPGLVILISKPAMQNKNQTQSAGQGQLSSLTSYAGTAWGVHDSDHDFFDYDSDAGDDYQYQYRYREGDVVTFQQTSRGMISSVVPERMFRRQECTETAISNNNNTRDFCRTSAASRLNVLGPVQLMTSLGVAAVATALLI
jgi:hypothetical protein